MPPIMLDTVTAIIRGLPIRKRSVSAGISLRMPRAIDKKIAVAGMFEITEKNNAFQIISESSSDFVFREYFRSKNTITRPGNDVCEKLSEMQNEAMVKYNTGVAKPSSVS